MTWWQWLLVAWGVIIAIGWGFLVHALFTAPLDTDIWPGGEPE